MALTKEMTEKELNIHQVKTKPNLIDVILSLLGLSDDKKIATHFDSNDAKPHIKSELYSTFDAKKLDELPELKLNNQMLTAESKWILRSNLDIEKTKPKVAETKKEQDTENNKAKEIDELNKKFAAGVLGNEKSEIKEELYFYPENLNDYTQSIQNVIDCMIPEKQRKLLIPITILIPDSDIQDGRELTGKKTNWKLFNIRDKNEDIVSGLSTASEFFKVMKDSNGLYALRLLLTFKLLKMAELRRDDNNLPTTFTDILTSTPLQEQLKYINKDTLDKYKELKNESHKQQDIINKNNRNLKRLNKSSQELSVRIDKDLISKDDKTKKIIKSECKLKEEEAKIKWLKAENANAGRQKKKIEQKIKKLLSEQTKPSEKFQYSLPSDKDLIFPQLTSSLKTQDFVTNKVGYARNKKSQSRSDVDSMRFALSRLLPYTSGTAITFYIPNTQKINSPLIILPQQWDDFVTSLKQYSYKKDKVKSKAKNEDVISSRTQSIDYHVGDAKSGYEQPPKYARFFPRIHSSAIDQTVKNALKETNVVMNKTYPVKKDKPVVIRNGKFVSPKK